MQTLLKDWRSGQSQRSRRLGDHVGEWNRWRAMTTMDAWQESEAGLSGSLGLDVSGRMRVAVRPSLGEQPAMELFVRHLGRSRQFYLGLGFRSFGSGIRHADLGWGDYRLHLYQPPSARWAFSGEVDATPRTNLRIPVEDVQAMWELVLAMKVRILEPLEDRGDGVFDFLIADPDGFGLRFGTFQA
jgi:hypothetical protein